MVQPLLEKVKTFNNPSPSGDTWFDDPQNVAYLEDRIESSKNDRHYIIDENQNVREFFKNYDLYT